MTSNFNHNWILISVRLIQFSVGGKQSWLVCVLKIMFRPGFEINLSNVESLRPYMSWHWYFKPIQEDDFNRLWSNSQIGFIQLPSISRDRSQVSQCPGITVDTELVSEANLNTDRLEIGRHLAPGYWHMALPPQMTSSLSAENCKICFMFAPPSLL